MRTSIALLTTAAATLAVAACEPDQPTGPDPTGPRYRPV